MPNEEAAPAAETPETADFSTTTAFSACYATHCRFNSQNACMMRQIEIAKNGQCMNFEIRKPEHVREYLEKRGDLSPAAIDEIMRQVQEKESSNVSN